MREGLAVGGMLEFSCMDTHLEIHGQLSVHKYGWRGTGWGLPQFLKTSWETNGARTYNASIDTAGIPTPGREGVLGIHFMLGVGSGGNNVSCQQSI